MTFLWSLARFLGFWDVLGCHRDLYKLSKNPIQNFVSDACIVFSKALYQTLNCQFSDKWFICLQSDGQTDRCPEPLARWMRCLASASTVASYFPHNQDLYQCIDILASGEMFSVKQLACLEDTCPVLSTVLKGWNENLSVICEELKRINTDMFRGEPHKLKVHFF